MTFIKKKKLICDWFTYPCLFGQLLLSLAPLSTVKTIRLAKSVIKLHSNSNGGYMVDLTLRPGRHSSCNVLSHHLNLHNLDLIFSYILMILLIKYCLKIIIYIEFIGIQL